MAYTHRKIRNRIGLFFKKQWLCWTLVSMSVLTAAAQDQRIVFQRQSLSVRDVMVEITNQTGYTFAVSHTRFDDSRTVYFSKQTATLREALGVIVAGSNHTYQIRGQQILIIALKEPEPETAKKEPKRTSGGIATGGESKRSIRQERSMPLPGGAFDREVELYTSKLVEKSPSIKPAQAVEPVKQPVNSVSSHSGGMRAQPTVGVKTNLLYGAVAQAPNLALEFGLSPKTSLDLFVGWNPWGRDKVSKTKKLAHIVVKPEVRYWLCERFNGHFFGVHPFYWDYNVSGKKVPLLFDKEYRYEGDAWGGGLSYGYHWMWGKRWGLEFNAGVGAAFMKYKKFEAEECGENLGDYRKKYFGPTNVGVKVMFMIK